MKKKIFFISVVIFLITSNYSKSMDYQSCARSWMSSVTYITQRHLADQYDCMINLGMNWVGMDPVGAIMDMSCSTNAYNDFSISLNHAAAQFEACFS